MIASADDSVQDNHNAIPLSDEARCRLGVIGVFGLVTAFGRLGQVAAVSPQS